MVIYMVPTDSRFCCKTNKSFFKTSCLSSYVEIKYAEIVILGGQCESTNIVCHALSEKYHIEKIIIEDPTPRQVFIRKRLKRLGAWKVIG